LIFTPSSCQSSPIGCIISENIHLWMSYLHFALIISVMTDNWCSDRKIPLFQ
jgi:hypothetical protein